MTLISAMVLGFLGSFHCIGMCGPIALSLPVQHLQGSDKMLGIGLYNTGRVTMYALLGVFFGAIGFSFQYFGWQQLLSVAMGSLLILIFLIRVFGFRLSIKKNADIPLWNRIIISKLYPLMQRPQKRFLFLTGFLNGLLPCGLVYMALAGAIATGNIIHSALFMAGFGAGTLPAMVMASFAAGAISLRTRNKIRKSLPYLLGIMGLLLILRGMDLDIPYLSPHLATNVIHCH